VRPDRAKQNVPTLGGCANAPRITHNQNKPMPTNHLFSALRAGFPDPLNRIAITCPETDTHYTWADLDRGSAMIANLLASLDLPTDSRVAVQAEKSVEALMLYLAVLRAGLVYLPLNTAYQSAEMAYFIENAEPAVVVGSGKNFGWLGQLAFTRGTKHVFTLNDDRTGTLLERAAHHSDTQQPVARGRDDLAAILYTSGTTGRSKGAMLTHGNLLSNAQTLKSHWQWQPNDVLVHALPLFHVHGLFVASHGALLNGSPMIWFGKFDPRAVVAQLPNATVFMGVPTLYVRLLAEPGFTRDVCRSMRLFVSGSAPLLIDTFDRFKQRTGFTILERYGMSETGMLSSNPCDPKDDERRGGTVGFPVARSEDARGGRPRQRRQRR
jgi:malonyl-CoA/methylmalonyl-CoA synthetase